MFFPRQIPDSIGRELHIVPKYLASVLLFCTLTLVVQFSDHTFYLGIRENLLPYLLLNQPRFGILSDIFQLRLLSVL